jgi:hypothetical protein
LLLHFDSINNVSGSNRLLDNSPYQRVVNVSGGSLTTSPANLSPIGSVASLQLNTNSDGSGFPEFPVNARGAGLNAGTGDFTFEWWGKHIGPAEGSSSSYMPIGAIFSTENDGANGTPHIWIDRLQNRDNSYSVVLTGWYRSTTGYPDPIRIWAADITSRMGQWTHYAVSRTGGVTRVFINGALATLGTVSNYASFPFDTTATSVNDPSNWDFLSPYSDATGNTGLSLFGFRAYKVGGFVDEARYTVGVGRYTESFSPPAAAFPNTGPVIVPDAPTNLAATGGNQQIALTWTAPVRNGGGAIIDYVVQYSSNAGSSWTTAEDSQTTSKTITGLTNLTGYLVRVAARNSAGVGEYVTSGTVTPSEPVVITQQPLNTYTSTTDATAALSVAATVGGGALTYQWQWYGPDYFNGDYNNQWRDMPSQTSSTVSLSANYVSGTLGYYDFDYSPTVKVRCAVAVSGGSPTYTQEVRFICLQNVHAPSAYWYNGTDSSAANSGQPQTISLVNGESLKVDISDSAYAVFDMSWFSGNDVIVKVQVATSGFTDAADWTDLSSTGYRGSFSVSAYEIAPSAGTKYYRVIAVANWPFTATDGTASFSPASPHRYPLTNYDVVQVTWPSPLDAPTSLTATAGNAQIALSWTAPSAPGASAITGYTVEYTPSGGSAQTVSTGSTSTSYTLTGLTGGTAYSVRVRAVSATGNGDYSTAVTRTPASVIQLTAAGFTTSGNFGDQLVNFGTTAKEVAAADWRVTGTTNWGDSYSNVAPYSTNLESNSSSYFRKNGLGHLFANTFEIYHAPSNPSGAVFALLMFSRSPGTHGNFTSSWTLQGYVGGVVKYEAIFNWNFYVAPGD